MHWRNRKGENRVMIQVIVVMLNFNHIYCVKRFLREEVLREDLQDLPLLSVHRIKPVRSQKRVEFDLSVSVVPMEVLQPHRSANIAQTLSELDNAKSSR